MFPVQRTEDPIVRYGLLGLKILVYAWVGYFFYQAATTFYEYTPGQPWPFMLSTLRMFTFLPIHEAGHFLFSAFGRTLYILGGSFWQVMIPLLWCAVAARQKSNVAPFAAFWVGENLMDVSLYMRDAPVRALPLLGGHASRHDWYNLFSDWNLLDASGTIADIVFTLGCAVAAGAIGAGIWLAFIVFFRPPGSVIPPTALQRAAVKVEDSLSSELERKESGEERFD